MRVSTHTPSAFLVFVALGLVAAGCDQAGPSGENKGAAQQAVSVTVQPVSVRPAQRYVEVTGTLFGEEEVTISNKVPGKVIAVYKDVGDRVAPGEPLAQLLQNDYVLARNQRESALREVLAKLGTDKVPPADFDPAKLPSVERARLQSENARSRFERGRQLHQQNPPLLAEQDFADLQTAYDVARGTYEVELLGAKALASEARTRQAELAIAEQALRDTTIRAPRPMGGADEGDDAAGAKGAPPPAPAQTQPADASNSFAVAARYVSVGELLAPITRMFRVVDDNPLKLRAPVREQFVGELKVGNLVLVGVDGYPGREFPGTVSRISPQIDPSSRTFQIEVIIPNDAGLLRPGGFARARVQSRVDPDVLFVPKQSVVTFAGVNKVFTVKDGKAQEIPIELGRSEGQDVEVTKAPKEGLDAVVVSGAQRLATGTPVVVTPGGQQESAGHRDTGPTTRVASDGAAGNGRL